MIVIISARCLNTAPAACEQMKTFGHLGHPNMQTASTIKAITDFTACDIEAVYCSETSQTPSAHCSERELFTLSQTIFANAVIVRSSCWMLKLVQLVFLHQSFLL